MRFDEQTDHHEEGQIRILQIMQCNQGKSNSAWSPDAGTVFSTMLMNTGSNKSFLIEDLIAVLQKTNSQIRYLCH